MRAISPSLTLPQRHTPSVPATSFDRSSTGSLHSAAFARRLKRPRTAFGQRSRSCGQRVRCQTEEAHRSTS
ncbi:hypothetical protein [Ktedonospora formicarum]|uniref:hypothetical protein n=1 Tax=Ktedonospora formicarum TaxID=2778364 RepID=UPI001F3AD0BC|nr:hypothetical protein [Ktedonospora formicarum]